MSSHRGPGSTSGRAARRTIPRLAAVALVAASIAAVAPARAQPAAAASGAPSPSAPQPAAAPTPAAAPAPRAAGRGAVVVALGDGATDAARALAREVYADPALRPAIDEPTAQVLAGGTVPADAPAIIRDRAALRASLAPDLASPATRRALESVAAELGAAAVIAVVRGVDGEPRARVVLAGAADGAPLELVGRVDPTGAPTWPSALLALRGVMVPPSSPAPPAAARPPRAPSSAPPGPGAAASRPGAAPAAPPPPAEESSEFYERPWFWVALGAFAAAGLTALVVTQTADGDEASDSVRFRATIPEAQLTFP